MRTSSKFLLIIFLSFLFLQKNYCQILSSSEHPIVIINTGNINIPDEPKINGTIGIIDNGNGMLNHINDPFNHFEGNIGIETRGNSTQDYEKKTYSFETRTPNNQDTSVALLGMGKEEDWILHAMVIDKSQLRIPLSFDLFQKMGHYASNWRFVEVIVNGDYHGLYILTEKIKRDDDRVDIAKLDADDLAGDSVTGGYILRIDWLDDPEGFESNFNSQGGVPMFFQWYYPKFSKIKPEQEAYIQNYMAEFESAIFSDDFTNSLGKRYNDYLNIESFADFLLINELSKNSDGYKLSTYLHKDKESKGGKLNAGPIWDFDQTYGMSTVCSNDDFTGWTYLQNQPECEDLETMPMWWQRLMADTVFTNYLACRWDTLRVGAFHEDSILLWIDTQVDLISNAIDRNFMRWDDFLGEYIWSEPEPLLQTYSEEIIYLKNWISSRLTWMDENLPGNCENNILSKITETSRNQFSVYPNPAEELIFILGKRKAKIKLVNINGQIIYSGNFDGNIHQIAISDFPKGIYFISINGDGFNKTKKIMIK